MLPTGEPGESADSDPVPGAAAKAGEDTRLGPGADPDELVEVRFVDLVRAQQTSPLPPPLASSPTLPIGALDPEVLERLAAEMIKRQGRDAHFYGRRGQKQYGLDILEREAAGNRVYQVRRYATLTPDMITAAVTEYADRPQRRFAAQEYVLLTSAEFENDTALQDRLEELQARYDGDLIIRVWGREILSSMLRDSGALVNSMFGPEWARSFCGFAPPPLDPADPPSLGLVQDPIEVLLHGPLASDAKSLADSDPLGAARLHGMLADALEDASFPGHATRQRERQAELLQAGGDRTGAFSVLWQLTVAHFDAGAARRFSTVHRKLEELRPGLSEVQAAKLTVLTAAQDWYECGSQLTATVPALEIIAAAVDPDAAFLACIILEQAVVDGWYDFDPPYALIGAEDIPPELLSRLRQCARGLSGPEVVLRARLACALADASLTANCTAADTDTAFSDLVERAGAGRYLHAGGMVVARAARAFAMHGDTARVISLWRIAIRLSSESRLYGDVLACGQALDAALLEQPAPAFDELGHISSLPNADRLLAAAQPAELDALRSAHASRLPDALGVTRRYLWEARLSGHLGDERDALMLFGDIMWAGSRQKVAVIAWVMAGAAKKAADHAGRLTALVGTGQWVSSPARAQQAAAVQVIEAQARLYGPAETGEAVPLLLGLATRLWKVWKPLIVAPCPELDAVNALSSFGEALPASAVDPVLELFNQPLAAGVPVISEAIKLLVQLHRAVSGRREDLAAAIGKQLALAEPPPELWPMVANMTSPVRDPLTPVVTALADAGNAEALLTMAQWGQVTDVVQLATRRTCAHLLRQAAGQPAASWSATTQFRDAVLMLTALLATGASADIDPRELRPGAGPVVFRGTLFTRITVPADPSPAAGESPPPPGQDRAEDGFSERAGIAPAASDHPRPAAGPGKGVDADPAWDPDRHALVAAGAPAALAEAVAEHLLAVAESHHPPAFVRTEALVALNWLLGHLTPQVNSHLVKRFLALAEDPGLSEDDQAELATQDPLSRGRVDLGARALSSLALYMAARAAAPAADPDVGAEGLPGDAAHRLIARAVQLLHSPDTETAKWGAAALAAASRTDPSRAHYGTALIVDPREDIRAAAVPRVVLDQTAQQLLAADSSPRVRAALAHRASELTEETLATLRADDHPEVTRALTAGAGPDGSNPEPAPA